VTATESWSFASASGWKACRWPWSWPRGGCGPLGADTFTAAFEEGAALPLDEVITYALGEKPVEQAPAGRTDWPARRVGTGLTQREREIATLVVEGLTNREIASGLVISRRTAEGHVENILSKLGFTTRAQIAAWVGSTTRRGLGRR
jgi:DNA-binding CsgD family transcriptional regulator